MSIYFVKGERNRSDSYVVKTKGFNVSYSVSSYGEYAKILAELSDNTLERYNNIYIEHNHYMIMKVRYKDNFIDFKIDKDCYDLIKDYRWKVLNSPTPYLVTRLKNGKHLILHRFLLGVTDSNILVDHKNRNTTDMILKNLRIVDRTTNNRNRSLPKTNKCGVMGVYRTKKNWECAYIDEITGKKKTKTFSINKYGEEKAFELAKQTRIRNTKHYNRITLLKIKRKCL